MKISKKKHLEMILEKVPNHPNPKVGLEQYSTPATIAADLVWNAYGLGDIRDMNVLDLGCGTGLFAIASSLMGARSSLGVDIDDESIALAKYPVCSWVSDAFTNWLTEQGTNQVTSGISNTIQSGVSGAAVGGFYGAAIGAGITAVGEIASSVGAFEDAKLLPSITSGTSTGDVNWAMGANNYFFKQMQCKTEYIRIIDGFFTRFLI
jgi:SAM-dependent methyltransferase